MKLKFTILFVVPFQLLAIAQEVKAKKTNTLIYVEEYSVLASDKKVRHGDYKKYVLDGSQICTGRFDNNKKVGKWNYYDRVELDQTFDFDKNELVFQKEKLTPDYVGFKMGLTDELNKVLKYPKQAARMGVEGSVILEVWINADGSLGEIELIKGIMKECDQDLISAIRKIPNNWIPGRTNKSKVRSKLTIEVKYQLDYIFQQSAVAVM